jgi:hypothetical protein
MSSATQALDVASCESMEASAAAAMSLRDRGGRIGIS